MQTYLKLITSLPATILILTGSYIGALIVLKEVKDV